MNLAFVGIGAQKSATTWAHRMLAAHPEISLPEHKELDFFSHYHGYGYEWYERHFADCSDGKLTGEFSPSYLDNPLAPKRLKAYAPDSKVIAVLRDPIQRAVSNHKHEIRLGRYNGTPGFSGGLKNNPDYLQQGLYAKHLKRWLEYFEPEQLLVMFKQDIDADPLAACQVLYDFVGVSRYEPENSQGRFNPSFANRSSRATAIKDNLYALTRGAGTSWLWRLLQASGLRSLYRRFNVVDAQEVIPELTLAEKLELQNYFREDIEELEKLLGRDLPEWRVAPSADEGFDNDTDAALTLTPSVQASS